MKKLLVLVLALFLSFSFAADQMVTVSGVAKEKKPVKEAMQDALHEAFIAAVEKNLGTWLKSQSSSVSFSESNEFAEAKMNVLSKADEFIVDYKVVKKGLSTKGYYEVTANVTVSGDRLSGELRKYVSALKSKMDNPSIAFVLTSWEKKGVFTTTTAKVDVSSKNSYSGNSKSSDYAYEDSQRSGSVSARADGSSYDERSVSASERGSGSASVSSSERGSGSARVSASERGSGSARVSGSESASVRGGSSRNGASYQGEYAASGSYDAERNYEGSGSYEAERNYEGSGSYNAERNYDGQARSSSKSSRSVDASYSESGSSARRSERGQSVQGNSESNTSATASITTGKIDETMYAKFADMGIIDGFQQEFKEKGFDLKAADKAREIAVAPSALATGININDRSAVRDLAEKEGANFVARGEVMLINQGKNSATGQPEITAKIGSEIIDVNSGDVVASYSNTVTATSSNIDKAKAQVIKKAAVVAAKTLASQTLQTWQERAEKGRQYTVEIRNMTKARSQKLPFEKALKAIASISSQTSPATGVQTYTVLYKGNKSDLGMAIIEAIGDAKGFSEEEFDGPSDENGKIVFQFTK